MSYDQALPGGGYQPSEQDRETEVMGSEEQARYQPREQAEPQWQMGGYPPQPGAAGKTEIMYRPPKVMAWLAVASGPRAGRLYTLSPDATTVGREAHNDIIVDDGKVSRQHAKIKCEALADDQHQFFIFDLATSNGTIVNGEQILKAALYDGDRIELGKTVLVFKQIDGPQRPAPDAEEEAQEASQEGD